MQRIAWMERSEIRGLGLSSPTTTLADRTFISDDTCVTGKEFIVVRNPKDELKTGTYYAMFNQLGITDRDLRK
ncbi:MAG TPA: hypothetical protein VE735_08515 [Gammaproteobacteria bacterium]|jgi:hypothetical protein|nr:hypothetical protein [Gammaproteobacteria bacterium]